jgi:hypothetical protein
MKVRAEKPAQKHSRDEHVPYLADSMYEMYFWAEHVQNTHAPKRSAMIMQTSVHMTARLTFTFIRRARRKG